MKKKAQKNLEKFNTYLETDERFAKLQVMYEALGDQLITAPASGKVQFHNAFPGGYLDHIVNVADAAIAIATAYKKMGGEIDFTKQELVFSALHHDLGKLGSEDGPYYIDQVVIGIVSVVSCTSITIIFSTSRFQNADCLCYKSMVLKLHKPSGWQSSCLMDCITKEINCIWQILCLVR